MDANMNNYQQMLEDYRRIEQAINFLAASRARQPSLREVAESLALSEYHFQRLFTRWVGISPKRFLQYLTKEYAKALLEESHNVLQVSYQAGLSGPGRLHDLFVTCEAVTPGEFKRRGEGLVIDYGFHPTPFGECLLALTERGISNLIFIQNDSHAQALTELRRAWGRAELRFHPQRTEPVAAQIMLALQGDLSKPLALHLRGSNFQLKVWEALLRIPQGAVTSYQELAVAIGRPGSERAVGHAVGCNPIPLLIPCHRVIRKTGELGGYRYGIARKQAILGWEIARSSMNRVEGASVEAG